MSQEAGFCLLVSCLCWATTLQIGSYSLYLVFISFATSHPYLLYYLLGGDLINFYWSIQLIYSVVVVSAVEQISYIYTYLSTSVTYTRICSFFRFFSHIGHFIVLSGVPYATQWVLIIYPFYFNMLLIIHSFHMTFSERWQGSRYTFYGLPLSVSRRLSVPSEFPLLGIFTFLM